MNAIILVFEYFALIRLSIECRLPFYLIFNSAVHLNYRLSCQRIYCDPSFYTYQVSWCITKIHGTSRLQKKQVKPRLATPRRAWSSRRVS